MPAARATHPSATRHRAPPTTRRSPRASITPRLCSVSPDDGPMSSSRCSRVEPSTNSNPSGRLEIGLPTAHAHGQLRPWGDEHSERLALIRCRLAGETVNNTVGIKVVSGPFNGRSKIVELDQSGLPPASFRVRPGRASEPWNSAAKHIYLPVRVPDTAAGWIYEYAGIDTAADAHSAATGHPPHLGSVIKALGRIIRRRLPQSNVATCGNAPSTPRR